MLDPWNQILLGVCLGMCIFNKLPHVLLPALKLRATAVSNENPEMF